jgi:hypothetical protein
MAKNLLFFAELARLFFRCNSVRKRLYVVVDDILLATRAASGGSSSV